MRLAPADVGAAASRAALRQAPSSARPVATSDDGAPRASGERGTTVREQLRRAALIPCLRLFADEVVIHRTEGLGSVFETERMPLIELSFEYDGVRVSRVRRGRRAMIDLDHYVPRDDREEGRARRLLESFGAVPLDCLDDWATSVHADYVVRCEGNVHDFCALQRVRRAAARASGGRSRSTATTRSASSIASRPGTRT